MTDEDIIKLAQTQKYFVKDIAIMAGKSTKIVTKILKKNNISIKRGAKQGTKHVEVDDEQLIKLLDQKLTYEEIGQKLGVSRGTIGNRVKEMGFKTKTATQSRAARNEDYFIWDKDKLAICKQLLEQYRNYDKVAKILNLPDYTIENANRRYFKIRISQWHDDISIQVSGMLRDTKGFAEVSKVFNIPPEHIRHKNDNDWKIDLSDNCLVGSPTIYNNIRYSSQSEANVALFFDQSGIEFEYAKKVIHDRLWTCDFYLPKFDLWVEYDGLGRYRDSLGDENYDVHEKIRFYQENGYRHMILGKRTWKQQLDAFLKI